MLYCKPRNWISNAWNNLALWLKLVRKINIFVKFVESISLTPKGIRYWGISVSKFQLFYYALLLRSQWESVVSGTVG